MLKGLEGVATPKKTGEGSYGSEIVFIKKALVQKDKRM